MTNQRRHRVAIVNYGVGNLFSVRAACECAGLDGFVTDAALEIREASAVILPGVGAFGDAMEALRSRDLPSVLLDVADAGTPLLGICLGMQLLMTESSEFGSHEGLGIIPGRVVPLRPGSGPSKVKVPHVGWNRLQACGTGREPWAGTLLEGLEDGAFMYFVHSYVVQPEDEGVVIARTRCGENDFPAVLQSRNLFACQGHPERSGPQGLTVYHNLARTLALRP